MGWIIGIIIIIASIYFLFRFPKQTFILIGVFIGICLLIGYFLIYVPEQKRKAIEDSVSIILTYDSKFCGMEYPLYVEIVNGSNKTIERVTWYLNAYIPGYSTDLSGYNNDYSNDKILKPTEKWSTCYKLPSTLDTQGLSASNLKYEVSMKNVYVKE
jgi:hypothetical protein